MRIVPLVTLVVLFFLFLGCNSGCVITTDTGIFYHLENEEIIKENSLADDATFLGLTYLPSQQAYLIAGASLWQHSTASLEEDWSRVPSPEGFSSDRTFPSMAYVENHNQLYISIIAHDGGSPRSGVYAMSGSLSTPTWKRLDHLPASSSKTTVQHLLFAADQALFINALFYERNLEELEPSLTKSELYVLLQQGASPFPLALSLEKGFLVGAALHEGKYYLAVNASSASQIWTYEAKQGAGKTLSLSSFSFPSAFNDPKTRRFWSIASTTIKKNPLQTSLLLSISSPQGRTLLKEVGTKWVRAIKKDLGTGTIAKSIQSLIPFGRDSLLLGLAPISGTASGNAYGYLELSTEKSSDGSFTIISSEEAKAFSDPENYKIMRMGTKAILQWLIDPNLSRKRLLALVEGGGLLINEPTKEDPLRRKWSQE